MSKKIKKKYSVIDTMEKDKDTGDARFKRYEYWGIGSCYLVHYVGDHSLYKAFKHRNSTKQERPFIRSAPFVKPEVRIILIKLIFTFIIMQL